MDASATPFLPSGETELEGDSAQDYEEQLFQAVLMEEEVLENVPIEEIPPEICTRFDLNPSTEHCLALSCLEEEELETQLEFGSSGSDSEDGFQLDAITKDAISKAAMDAISKESLDGISEDARSYLPQAEASRTKEDQLEAPEISLTEELASCGAMKSRVEAVYEEDAAQLAFFGHIHAIEFDNDNSTLRQRLEAEDEEDKVPYQLFKDAFKTDRAGSAEDEKKWIYENREIIHENQKILEQVNKQLYAVIREDQQPDVDENDNDYDDEDDDDGEQETPCDIWDGGSYRYNEGLYLVNDMSSESGLRLVQAGERPDTATRSSIQRQDHSDVDFLNGSSELVNKNLSSTEAVLQDALGQPSKVITKETDYVLEDYACGVDYAEGIHNQREGDSREYDVRELSADVTRSEFLSFDDDPLEDIYTRWCQALDTEETDEDLVKDLLLGNEEERRSFVDFVARTKPEHLHVDRETGMARSARVVALACPGEARRTEVAAVLSANIPWTALTLTEGLTVPGGAGHSLHICALLQALICAGQTEVVHILLQMNLPLLLLSMWHRPGCSDLLLCLLLGSEVFPPKACGTIRREVVQYLHGASWKRCIADALWVPPRHEKPRTEKGELTLSGSHVVRCEYDEDSRSHSRETSPIKQQAGAELNENDSSSSGIEGQLSRLPSPSRRSPKKERREPETPPAQMRHQELYDSPSGPAMVESPPISPSCKSQTVTFSGVSEFLCRVLEACSKCSEAQRLRDVQFQRALSLLFHENEAIACLLLSVVSGRCRFHAVSLLYDILRIALTPKGCLHFLSEHIFHQYFQFIEALSCTVVQEGLNLSLNAGTVPCRSLKLQSYIIPCPLGSTLTTLVQILSLVVHHSPGALTMMRPECWVLLVQWFVEHRCNQIFHMACCRILITLLYHGDPALIQHVFENLGLAMRLALLAMAESRVARPLDDLIKLSNILPASNPRDRHFGKSWQNIKRPQHPGGMGNYYKVVATLHNLAVNGFGSYSSSDSPATDIEIAALRRINCDETQQELVLEDAPKALFSLQLPCEEVPGCSYMSAREWQAEPQLALSKLLGSIPLWSQAVDMARTGLPHFEFTERHSYLRAANKLSGDSGMAQPEEQPPPPGDSEPNRIVKVPEAEPAVEMEPDEKGSCENVRDANKEEEEQANEEEEEQATE